MARKHAHEERITDELADGAGAMLGVADLGPGAKVIKPKKPPLSPAAPAPDPDVVNASMFLHGLETDLHARDERGRRIPTLAERIASEGFAAQLNPAKKGKRA